MKKNRITSNGELIIFTLLMIISIFYMIFKGSTGVYIFGIFFVFLGCLNWYTFIFYDVIKPKEETLFMFDSKDNLYYFINKKGKNFCIYDKRYFEVNKFYLVLKKPYRIVEIIRTSNETFDVTKANQYYWSKFYSPVSEFEKYNLLFVFYIMFIFSFFSLLYKFDFSIFIIGSLSLYCILYDFIYKFYKKKYGEDNYIKNILNKSNSLIITIINSIPYCFISLFLVALIISTNNIILKLIISALLFYCIYEIRNIIKKN